MTIRTYSNQLMSRWQSALYSMLDQDALEQGMKAVESLGSEHPVMAASCIACDELEREIAGWFITSLILGLAQLAKLPRAIYLIALGVV